VDRETKKFFVAVYKAPYVREMLGEKRLWDGSLVWHCFQFLWR
jgi:hypothetical protein